MQRKKTKGEERDKEKVKIRGKEEQGAEGTGVRQK